MTEPKIEIGVKYLRYLGHIVSHSEVFSDPKKVEAIMEEQIKANQKELAALHKRIDEQAAALDEQKAANARANVRFDSLYTGLAALSADIPTSGPLPSSRNCASAVPPDTAIEVAGDSDANRVLSLSVCNGRIEMNSGSCTVDPCDLERYVRVLKVRLEALKDV